MNYQEHEMEIVKFDQDEAFAAVYCSGTELREDDPISLSSVSDK